MSGPTPDPFGRDDEAAADPFGRGEPAWLPPVAGQSAHERRESGAEPVFTPPMASPGGPPKTPGRATAAMILGICGVLFCPLVLSVPAIVLGSRAKREIDASGGALGGRGQATAGIVLGWVGTAFALIFIALALIGAFGLAVESS